MYRSMGRVGHGKIMNRSIWKGSYRIGGAVPITWTGAFEGAWTEHGQGMDKIKEHIMGRSMAKSMRRSMNRA